MPPAISVNLPALEEDLRPGGIGVADAARAAEEAGIDAVSAPDFIVGDGTPALEGTAVLAAAAGATRRIGLEFGVIALPVRPLALLAAQVQTLQHLSGHRIRLGTGLGGAPGSPFWKAVGAPATHRGKLADRALALLPPLIRGEPAAVPGPDGPTEVTLAPGAPVPPILIGGGDGDAPLRRAAAFGQGWAPSFLSPAQVAAAADRLAAFAAELGRPVPEIHLGAHALVGKAATRAARDALFATLGGFAQMSAEEVAGVTLTGSPAEVAERIAAYTEAGVTSFGLALGGPDYRAGLDAIAEARSLLT